MAIVNAQLTGSQQDILTVPSGKTYAITNILVCNNSSSTAGSFDLHFIPDQAVKDDNVTRIINTLELPATETFTFDSERIILEAGDSVSFVGDTVLAATISYLEV